MSKDAFGHQLDALLTMPEGWSIACLGKREKGWYCTLSGPHGALAWSAEFDHASDAIAQAKRSAEVKDVAMDEDVIAKSRLGQETP